MEIGMYSFGDLAPQDGRDLGKRSHRRLMDLLEEIELADQLGLDVFALGEHHREDFTISAPAVVLAAAASKTTRIKLSSAVSVLSSDDPVRVFQQFATLDLLSGGRAEIMAGRGSFIESFPLFGFDLDDYDDLFSEKLTLLLKIRESERISWQGNHRPAINNLGVYPRPLNDKIPVWVAVGGTPQSVLRAATLGLPLALAIIGGSPVQFTPLIQLYRDTCLQRSMDAAQIQVGINAHVFVADQSQHAADNFYPSYAAAMTRIGRERGWQPMNRDQYELMRSMEGSLLVGSPQQVIDKILFFHSLFSNTRFLAQMSVGEMAHDKMMRSIELFATKVAPVIRRQLQ